MRENILFCMQITLWAISRDIFEGAQDFLDPWIVQSAARDNLAEIWNLGMNLLGGN